MAIRDQFETEAPSFYSGSYNDYFVEGSALSFITSTLEPNSIRRVTALKSTGRNTAWNQKIRLASQILPWVSQSNAPLQKFQRFVGLSDEIESFYDSYVASPIDYHLADSNAELVSPISDLGGSDRFNLDPVVGPKPGVEFFSAFVQFASPAAGGTGENTEWYDSFPFESKYKDFAFSDKLFKLSNIQPKIYPISRRVDGVSISPPSSSRDLAVISYDLGGGFELSLVDSEVHPTSSLSDKILRATVPTIQKTMFGIGDIKKRDPTLVAGRNWCDAIPITTEVGVPLLRGWKYGLWSGLPHQPKAIFRISNFGQFRDMLEQRPQTAFLVQDEGRTAVSFPVQVTFVSGTTSFDRAEDYVTASNPTYDPNDTGFYDKRYRAGQPFFDG